MVAAAAHRKEVHFKDDKMKSHGDDNCTNQPLVAPGRHDKQ